MNTSEQTPSWAEPRTASFVTRVPIEQIETWIANGRLPVEKIHQKTHVNLDDVERLAREARL